jgi:hypothetical protein
MSLVVNVCPTETYSHVRTGKNLSDFFIINLLKQGDTLSQLFLNFALEYAIRRFKVNEDGLKSMIYIRFCFIVMILIYWWEAYKVRV